MTSMLTDAELTEILGPKCGGCGWRGGRHRPPIAAVEACPEYEPAP